MIRRTLITLLLLASAALAQMGTSAGHDLDALWVRAQADYDLSSLDAVLLLESREVTVTEDHDLVTRIHRIVWVGTRAGQNAHADLRIPWNSATSTFEVETLRTWRDNRWWPDAERLSDTAIVETLPYAVRTAWDYQDLRETMLLHDGVEAPCIMETAYTITERGGAAPGADGLFVFIQREPTVEVEFSLRVPQDTQLDHALGNGCPEPMATRDVGATHRRWAMSGLPARSLPMVDVADEAPWVRWSTWGREPEGLARHLDALFQANAFIQPAMSDSLAARLRDVATPLAKARTVAALVDDMTRHAHVRAFDRRFELRDALRVWDTGYADDADRALLAYTLFREAGLVPRACLVGADSAPGRDPLPGFAAASLMLALGHPAVLYDPASGDLRSTGNVTFRTPPAESLSGMPDHGHHAALDLSLTPSEDGWRGTGALQASGLLNPWPDMAGAMDQGLDRIAYAVLSGADADDAEAEWFDAATAVMGFSFSLNAPEPDEADRITLIIGDLEGGIVTHLPHGTDTWRETRTSPIQLPTPMGQRLTVHLSLGEGTLVRAPAPRELTNDVGRFALAVEETNGVLTVTRELELTTDTITTEQWPQLRALLLEEADPANRTILLRED